MFIISNVIALNFLLTWFPFCIQVKKMHSTLMDKVTTKTEL